MMIRKRKRLWALLLSAALIVTQLPAVAMAENNPPEDGSIASFDELPSGVAKQTVDVGTELSELTLPDTVTATIYHVTEDMVIPDKDNTEDDSGDTSTATPSDAEGSVSDNSSGDSSNQDSGKTVTTVTTSEEEIPVTWGSEPAYDGDAAGSYVFTADVGGYALSSGAKLPRITVTVAADTAENPVENPTGEPLSCTKTEGCTLEDGHEGECVTEQPPTNGPLVKTIIGWTFMDDENLNEGELPLTAVSMEQQADFDTVVSMLPTKISVKIEGEAESSTLGITGWSCPEYIQDGEGNWPLTGDYIFTAALPEGYACDPLPTIKTLLGGANTYAANNTIKQGGLTVAASNNGEVEYTEGSGFTLKSDGTYEISGEWSGTLNSTTSSNSKAVITVPDGITANVTLNGATIDVSGTDHACAFAVTTNGTAEITLSGTNTLTSGHSRAGLEVPKNAEVSIDGNGKLEAAGGTSSAGIGSSNGWANQYEPDAGNITIRGGAVVTAQGGDYAAGIGGGYYGSGGTTTITGGTVTAIGGTSGGAGIGGGDTGDGGTITISNDAKVTAQGGSYAAGIGGGSDGDGGTITINGGTVTAKGGASNDSTGGGAGIGGGNIGGSGGTITIGGGSVSATGGSRGAGIGGGSCWGAYIGSGGHITINGGIVEATGSESGAGIGGGGARSQDNGGEAGTIEISGDTVVFATAPGNGAHIGSGGNFSEEGTSSGSFTEGVVFEGEQGTVHGIPTLPGDVTIPQDHTLTVPDGSTLTIPDRTTLTNNGTLENNGTINGGGSITNNGKVNDHSGGITVTVNGANAVNKPSEVGISFWNSQNEQITQAAYGDTIKITATAQRKATNTLARGAALNKVDFYIGTIASEHLIDTADVVTDSSTATATLEIPLTGEAWNKGFAIGTNTITADFGGAGTLNLLGSTGTAKLTVKGSPILSLGADPAGSQTLPGNVTLTATLSDAYPDNAGKTIIFTVNGGQHGTAITNNFGVATYLITNLSQGGYTFDASFAGDTLNTQATAAQISGYAVGLGTQAELGIIGLDNAYTYGCEAFDLSTSGGSGSGAVSYISSNPAVASVMGSTVTIQKAGTFTITATKTADSHYKEATVTSGAVTVREAIPNISLMATGGSNTSTPITLTVVVSKVGTGATPTGTVSFTESAGTLNATVDLDSSGKASYTISNPEAGSHTYTAEYSGQTSYYTGASVPRTIGVGLTDQTGFAISDPGAKTYGDSDFTLTSTGGQGTGSVSFSVTSGNGVLTVAADGKVKIIGAGKVTVTATKDADSTYNQATATLEITVAPRDISNVTVNITGSRVYTGSQLQPVFEVKDGALAITTGDYTNSYGPNLDAGAGAGSITLTGQRNYTGTKTVQFDIDKRLLTGAVITLESSSYTHTGSEIKPAVTNVTVDGITVPAAEFDVGYADNKDVGTATVTITAKADGNFSGSSSTTYTITKADTPSGGNNDRDSSSDSIKDRYFDAKKGWVNYQTGIITGTGSGYSKWTQDENGWKLQYADGTTATGISMTADDGRTYERLTWELINGAWYAFGPDEYAKSGLVFDPDLGGYFYIDINTGMKTGWQLVNGTWRYFNPVSDGKKGIMLTDAWVDGWYVDRNGIWNGEAKKDT